MGEPGPTFVGRAGHKLAHALEVFGIGVEGMRCADFGCNVGGFTDCLLQRGAERVWAVDTGYGMLAWTLRNDPRVVVMERTNALHAEPPEGGVDLVAIDMGWTPQERAVPAALRWLREGGGIVSLIKPHYEATNLQRRGEMKDVTLRRGVLEEADAERVLGEVVLGLRAGGVEVAEVIRSPLVGGEGKGARGNAEYLALLRAGMS